MTDVRFPVLTVNAYRRQIENLAFALCFLPVFFAIRFLTSILSLVRFSRMLSAAHRMFSIRNRVLYLEAFFPQNAGYHYRTKKWVDLLNEHGFDARVRYVFDRETFERLLKRPNHNSFHLGFLFRRFWHCLGALAFNCVVVRRELLVFNDYGNLFLDKFLLALHPNVILDFDDDLSAAKREPRQTSLFGRLMFENPAKFSNSLRLYSRFIVGTTYLRDLVCQKRVVPPDSKNILTVPTCVDYEQWAPKDYDHASDQVTFGWIGSASNQYLLDIVVPVLSRLSKKVRIRFVVITSDEYKPNADFEIVKVPWTLETEIDSLHSIDIGLMPLFDAAEERGKCGFKLIQYMGLGIVSIASAVTVNKEIVEHGENGFLVYDSDDWSRVIEDVLVRRPEFALIGAAARKKIQDNFSFQAHERKYLEFIGSSLG